MTEDIDTRLQDIVERMFQRCAQDEEYEQAIGIALESRRLDVVKAMIEKGDSTKLLPYVLEVSMTLVQELEFRNQVRGDDHRLVKGKLILNNGLCFCYRYYNC
jgi:26S proteasome regulatory subunit N2